MCWKCGQSGHIGARCNQPTLTFDALDAVQAEGDGAGSGEGGVRSWAHVVKTGGIQTGSSSSQASQRVGELERQEAFLKKTKEDKIRKEEDDNAKLLATEVEASRVEAARVEADNVEATRVEATREEAERVEAERVEAERVEADDAEYAKAGADKEDAAKAEAIVAEAVIADASKAAVSDEVI